MTISLRTPVRAAALLTFAAVLGACSDGNPVAGGATPGEPQTPLAPVSAILQCTADVQPRTVSCTSRDPGTGAATDVIVGGQNEYVKLRSTNVQLTGDLLSADVTVQNLLARAMGTADGVTPAAAGTRVFFSSGPSVVAGSGTVTVANADGAATFTAAGQKYFQYGGILAPGATTAPRSWQFQMSPGVTQFVFTVYVASTVPGENGYIRLDPPNPLIAPGASKFISAWVVSAAGTESQGAALAWTSSDTTVARVAADGTVTGVANGTAVIAASDGVRSGTTTVTVGTVDKTGPSLTAFTFSPRTVNAGDSVTVTLSASDAGVGVRTVQAQLSSPSGSLQPLCTSARPASGTTAAGTYVCKIAVPPGAPAGTWTMSMVQLADQALNVSAYANADLVAARFATTLTVVDATPDATAPSLNGFTLAPTAVTAGDSVTATFTVADAGTGVASARVTLVHAASNRSASCVAATPATGTAASGTFQCRIPFSTGAANGSWQVSDLQLADRTGNVAQLTAATLASRGFASAVTVAGGTNDTHKPTLTSISFAPSPATTADSVTVTVGVADPESGAASVHVEIRSPLGRGGITCDSAMPAMGTRANGTFTCKAGFPAGAPTGTWTVYDVELSDAAGNLRAYQAGDLKGLGYASTLTVNP